ncbi:Uncharacterized protein BP5553_07539 [Venustampulla echinocandica]|uniref:Secreted protein n=1 Tax=Venustampulla echinocandica TaxID=2656787 RepID=A0A370TGT5_9HELO|nr:Uncharacterized protein BP5553_07539 [Venustampulla echinocandica]RDL34411.1 Uncharacterized protein BP5553_07539 [Venustampulla echinocandica]
MFAKLLTLALAATAYALPATSAPAVTPDPSQVSIAGITYGGTGCPQGSVGSYISGDRQTFTLIFDRYVASLGPGVAITENRKNCQLNINLKYPGGFQYSVFNTVYRGYIGIDAGVSGVQSTTFYFSGGTYPTSSQTTTSTTFKGPLDGNYEVSDNADLTSTVWSPCGASVGLNLNSQVRLTSSSGTATGQITSDSIDGHLTFVVGVKWQKC